MLIGRLGLRARGAAAALRPDVTVDALEQRPAAVADVVADHAQRAALALRSAAFPVRGVRTETQLAQPRLGRLGGGAAQRAESARAAGEDAHIVVIGRITARE